MTWWQVLLVFVGIPRCHVRPHHGGGTTVHNRARARRLRRVAEQQDGATRRPVEHDGTTEDDTQDE